MTPDQLVAVEQQARAVREPRYALMRAMRFKDGKTFQEIADTFGVSRQAVHALFQRKQWTTPQ